MLCHGYFSDFYFAAFFFFMLKGERLCTIKQRSFNKSVETNVCGCWWFIIKRGKKWENLRKLLCSVLQLDQNKRVFSIWLLAARFLALFPSRSASWMVPNFSFFTGPELWMTSSSFPSHKKKILPPQALKIPLGLGTQPPFQQLLTRAVAGPGASQNQEEKEAVWWKPAHTWVSLKCPVHRKDKNLPFLCPEISAQPWSHSFFSFLFLWGRGESMDVVF